MKVMNHPHKKDLVLLGGGHSHSIFLKMWGMNPMDKVRVTLVSDGTSTPYSGMLPGLIAGDYEYEEAHIDLRQLCEFAGVRFINSKITGLDPQRKCVHLEGRPSLRFDCVSLNLGSSPDSDGIAGAEKFGVGIKPVAKFLDFWSQLQKPRKTGVSPLRCQHQYTKRKKELIKLTLMRTSTKTATVMFPWQALKI